MTRTRGFEEVKEEHKKYAETITAFGVTKKIYPPSYKPVRSDSKSAGYDFFTPVDIEIHPGKKALVWTNVKAYMQDDEVLKVYVRSSIGTKHDVVLANQTGIIDASYYENPDNDGNIGICLRNITGQTKTFKAGERIAQGIFQKYLVTDEDETLNVERTSGFGSSGK